MCTDETFDLFALILFVMLSVIVLQTMISLFIKRKKFFIFYLITPIASLISINLFGLLFQFGDSFSNIYMYIYPILIGTSIGIINIIPTFIPKIRLELESSELLNIHTSITNGAWSFIGVIIGNFAFHIYNDSSSGCFGDFDLHLFYFAALYICIAVLSTFQISRMLAKITIPISIILNIGINYLLFVFYEQYTNVVMIVLQVLVSIFGTFLIVAYILGIIIDKKKRAKYNRTDIHSNKAKNLD